MGSRGLELPRFPVGVAPGARRINNPACNSPVRGFKTLYTGYTGTKGRIDRWSSTTKDEGFITASQAGRQTSGRGVAKLSIVTKKL